MHQHCQTRNTMGCNFSDNFVVCKPCDAHTCSCLLFCLYGYQAQPASMLSLYMVSLMKPGRYARGTLVLQSTGLQRNTLESFNISLATSRYDRCNMQQPGSNLQVCPLQCDMQRLVHKAMRSQSDVSGNKKIEKQPGYRVHLATWITRAVIYMRCTYMFCKAKHQHNYLRNCIPYISGEASIPCTSGEAQCI